MLDDKVLDHVLQEVQTKDSNMEVGDIDQLSISDDVCNIGKQELIRNSKIEDVAKIQFLRPNTNKT